MFWLPLLTLPAAVQGQGFSTTMLRFGCSQIAIDRVDPYAYSRHELLTNGPSPGMLT